VNWGNVGQNVVQGALNTVTAAQAAKSLDVVTFTGATIMAADNVYEIAKELSNPVQNALEVVGNGMNQTDVYWDSLDTK